MANSNLQADAGFDTMKYAFDHSLPLEEKSSEADGNSQGLLSAVRGVVTSRAFLWSVGAVAVGAAAVFFGRKLIRDAH